MKKLALCLLVLVIVNSTKAAYTHWVFEGAGIRGIAYVGAIKELDKRNYLDSVEAVGGTSAGSITACFIALGFTPQEMESELRKLNFRRFNDNRIPLFSGIRNITKYYGWYKGDAFEKWIRKLIATKTNNPNITFQELHNTPEYKDLYIMGASINNQRSINFNYTTYPDMQIATAVRISMSIPYYFKPVIINARGQRLKEKPKSGQYDICVDGGITSNLPVELFEIPEKNVLGFQIVRSEQAALKTTKKIAPYNNITGVGAFTKAIYNLTNENKQNVRLAHYPNIEIISISDGNIGPRIRKLKNKTVQLLLNNGINAARSFVN